MDDLLNGTYPNSLMMIMSSGFPGSYSNCEALNSTHYCSVALLINSTTLKMLASNITPTGDILPIGKAEEWISALTEVVQGIPINISTYLPLKLGICTPIECTSEDLTDNVDKYLHAIELVIPNLHLIIDDFTTRCTEDMTKLEDSPGAIAVVATWSLLGALAFLCTAYEVYKESSSPTDQKAPAKGGSRKSKKEQWFTSFGLISNTETLMAWDEPGYFSWFNCFRTISMSWVMLFHWLCFHLEASIPSNIYWMVKKWIPRFTTNIFMSADPCMETFFFMGGMLMCWSLYKKLKDGRMDAREWLLHFVHRYFRLTPIYALGIFSMHFLTPILIKGPYALWYELEQDGCTQWWWTNLLYINNFVPGPLVESCWMHTWFLAVDMQLFIFIGTPLTVIYFWKPICGMIATGAIVATCFACNLALSVTHWYPVCKVDVSWIDELDHAHGAPWMRMGGYAIGVSLAVFMSETQACREAIKRKVNNLARMAAFLFSGGAMIAVVLCTYPLYNSGVPGCWTYWSNWDDGIYWSVTRIAWPLSLATWTYLFWLDNTGVLCRIMSSWIWAVPSRLVYCVYLFHPLFAVVITYSALLPYVYNDLDYTQDWLGFILTTFFLAGFWHLFGEKPFCNIEAVIVSYVPKIPNPFSSRNRDLTQPLKSAEC
ncbi:nose resistant to fluoxetine protein 6 [Pelomyxa schiedti]|nr:nose resistant to fluoxetine protein 6 [Pelomyxa schiedti]